MNDEIIRRAERLCYAFETCDLGDTPLYLVRQALHRQDLATGHRSKVAGRPQDRVRIHVTQRKTPPSSAASDVQKSGGHGSRTRNPLRGTCTPNRPLTIRIPSKLMPKFAPAGR